MNYLYTIIILSISFVGSYPAVVFAQELRDVRGPVAMPISLVWMIWLVMGVLILLGGFFYWFFF